jgi:hypothetical protein
MLETKKSTYDSNIMIGSKTLMRSKSEN